MYVRTCTCLVRRAPPPIPPHARSGQRGGACNPLSNARRELSFCPQPAGTLRPSKAPGGPNREPTRRRIVAGRLKNSYLTHPHLVVLSDGKGLQGSVEGPASLRPQAELDHEGEVVDPQPRHLVEVNLRVEVDSVRVLEL